MTSSEMLEDALRRGERYSRIVNEGISVELDIGRITTIRLKYLGVERHLDRHQVEFWLTTIIRICRQLTGRRLVPSRLRVLHRQTGERRQLEAFFGCRVEFSADADEIVLADSIGQAPISSADAHLNDLLIDYCEEVLSRRKASRGSLRPDLENAIAVLLPHGKAQAGEISRKLGMSERTLARRLSREGLTLTRVLGDLKLELARRYLLDENLKISDIAWLLGYREASAFTHAFHRWFGKTPSEMRFKENLMPKKQKNSIPGKRQILPSSSIWDRQVMDHETEKYWGTLLLRMAADARQEGDLVTAELLSAHAKDYLDEADRLASRWRNFEARHGDELRGTHVIRVGRRQAVLGHPALRNSSPGSTS